MDAEELESPTPTMSTWCSNQLSYASKPNMNLTQPGAGMQILILSGPYGGGPIAAFHDGMLRRNVNILEEA
jgi:hypothetical protein